MDRGSVEGYPSLKPQPSGLSLRHKGDKNEGRNGRSLFWDGDAFEFHQAQYGKGIGDTTIFRHGDGFR